MIMSMVPVTEVEMREFVRATLEPGPGVSRVIDEFVVGERGRIDIAVLGERLRGFELKSDLDTLARLPRQMAVFSEVFDYCTLVVTDKHLPKARQLLLPGWGLSVVRRQDDVSLRYLEIRQAKLAGRIDSFSLASLLWRDEVLHALESLNASRGVRSKPRDILWNRLAEIATPDELRTIVLSALTARQGWRDVKAPNEHVATSPRGGVSSRFLARRFLPQRR